MATKIHQAAHRERDDVRSFKIAIRSRLSEAGDRERPRPADVQLGGGDQPRACFGEIGLTGRLRPAAQAERRLEECTKLGLSTVVAPADTPAARGKLQVLEAETLQKAIAAGLGS